MKTFIVDSFTDQAFKGNPAGVCLLDNDISETLMMQIAKELGFSETAFIKPITEPLANDLAINEIADNKYSIRFFTPKMEIALCGHATLASAKVIFEQTELSEVEFINIQQISLPVVADEDKIVMRFPVYETMPCTVADELLTALGLTTFNHSVYNEETKILLLEVNSSEILANINPDYEALYQSHDGINGVLVTAIAQDDYDFHSRYFWPWSGTTEDPVTGLTHTFLTKYWSQKLGKTKMKSFQNSERTGFMHVELQDNELIIKGNAVLLFKGEFLIS